MSDHPKIIYDDEPSAGRGSTRPLLVAAGCVLVAAWLVIGSVDSSVPRPDEVTPLPRAISVMPDLRGNSIIGAANLLSDAGLDRQPVYRASWIANPDVTVGTVSGQIPAPGVELFDSAEIDLVFSSGGPTIGWDEVPLAMDDLLDDGASRIVDEPILVIGTDAGNAYKVDDLLFGECAAVDLTRDTLYDRTFETLCPPPVVSPIVGWLGDGAMYAIDGLAQQAYLDVGSAISLGDEQLLGRQLWSISPVRQAPRVEVDGRTIRTIGGFYSFVLKIPDDSNLSPEEVGRLIAPSDIRGNLVVDLSPPLSFYTKAGIAGTSFPDGQSARRHRQVPGEPFAATSTVSIVSTGNGIELLVDDHYSADVEVLAVPAGSWTTHTTDRWQFAYPSKWTASGDGVVGSGILAVTTSDTAHTDSAECGGSPVKEIRNMGPEDAVLYVSVSQAQPSRHWPEFFDEGALGPLVSGYGSGCLGESEAQVRVGTMSYNGVTVELVSAFGSQADTNLRNEALAILTSLELAPNYLDG